MVLRSEGLGQEVLASARWKKDHSVTQVNDSHPATMIESPSMANRRRY
jgi:hypothetical protein